MKKHAFLLAALTLLLGASCTQKAENTLSGLNPADFETVVDGKPVALYTLKNAAGMEVCITNFGGRIVSLMVPDRNGEMRDVVLGFDNIADYQNVPSDFGASIGRYANRIDHGRLIIDGDTVQLPQNNFGHCLHGGPDGWQYKVYEARQLDGKTLELYMDSPDGDENFPGRVEAKVTYNLTDDNAIVIAYEATTDAPTVVNMRTVEKRQRLRPQLGTGHRRRRRPHRHPTGIARDRHLPHRAHHRTGHTNLLGQLPRRNGQRERRHRLQPPHRHLSRNTTLPRQPQQTAMALDPAAPRREIREPLHLRIFDC